MHLEGERFAVHKIEISFWEEPSRGGWTKTVLVRKMIDFSEAYPKGKNSKTRSIFEWDNFADLTGKPPQAFYRLRRVT